VRQRVDPSRALIALAAEQDGVVSREQALAHGMTVESVRRLLRQGWWQRLEGGLYYCDSSAVAWRALAWGGVLLGGDRSSIGGLAAAHLHGLTDPPEVITVLVNHGTKRVPRGPWHFVQVRPGVRRTARGAPPRLDVEDCVLDLCEDADTATVVDLLSRAVQSRRTTTDRLRARVDGRARHSRRALLRALLADVSDGAESPLELNYLNDVERRHGLPRGRRQHHARRTARDIYYEEFATVVELDGQAGHRDAGRHRDMRRDNRSTVSGEATLRYGWWDVLERACLVAAEVAAVLRLRGWQGVPTLCPDCRHAREAE
jgi:hypothetical protein